MTAPSRTWRDLRRKDPPRDRRGVTMQRSRAKTIQLIHVGARNLGLIDPAVPVGDPAHDELYRALIREATEGRHDSCATCTDQELAVVLNALQARGFRIEPTAPHGRRPRNMAIGDMRTKVEALLTSMSLPWAYAEAILRRQRGLPMGIACPITATNAIDLRYLIAALDKEQHKRRMLIELDAAIADLGITRDRIMADLDLHQGWDRRVKDLEKAIEYCQSLPHA